MKEGKTIAAPGQIEFDHQASILAVALRAREGAMSQVARIVPQKGD
jgi:hypothetical protein